MIWISATKIFPDLIVREQFMGRVNRSAKRKGMVYFFDFNDAAGVYGSDDVRIEEKVTLKMEAMRKILTTKDFS